jgi:hypothetical protein
MRLQVARIPGCAAPCRWSKTCQRRSLNTGVAEDVQIADFLFDNTQLLAEEEVLYLSAEDLTEGHVLKVKGALSVMAAQQEAAPVTAVPEVGRDHASTTTLDTPCIHTKKLVYSKINDRWRCWRPDDNGDTLVRADSSSLWLVHSWKGLPSRKERKCLIPEKAASSSMSKVE